MLDGNQPADVKLTDQGSAYAFVQRAPVCFEYHAVRSPDKTSVKRFLKKMTGSPGPPIAGLIQRHWGTGAAESLVRSLPTPLHFPGAVHLDEAFGKPSGPATKVIHARMFHVFGDARFEHRGLHLQRPTRWQQSRLRRDLPFSAAKRILPTHAATARLTASTK